MKDKQPLNLKPKGGFPKLHSGHMEVAFKWWFTPQEESNNAKMQKYFIPKSSDFRPISKIY